MQLKLISLRHSCALQLITASSYLKYPLFLVHYLKIYSIICTNVEFFVFLNTWSTPKNARLECFAPWPTLACKRLLGQPQQRWVPIGLPINLQQNNSKKKNWKNKEIQIEIEIEKNCWLINCLERIERTINLFKLHAHPELMSCA